MEFFPDDSQDAICNQAMDQFEEDQLCNQVFDRFERQREFQSRLIQQSGGSLDRNTEGRFEFDLRPHVDRRSDRMGVRERHFESTMRQTGNFIDRPQLVPALQAGLTRAINRVLGSDMDDRDRLYFTVASNRLTSNFQGWGLTAREWRNGGNRVDTLFNRLSDALNSNENFEMNDTFQVSITRVRHAPRASGSRRKLKPGHRPLAVLKRKKENVIQIQNKDCLCCARALVTAKARADNHPQWGYIRKGRKMQRSLAVQLHGKARVPLGECGYTELSKFQEYLEDYRIILVDADRGFACKAFAPPGKPEVVLLYSDHHYDVITSLPGFYGTSYVCAHCLKAYNTVGEHRCEMKSSMCGACRQVGCEDFMAALLQGIAPTRRCHFCRRAFFGERCFEKHLMFDRQHKHNPGNAVCKTMRRCPTCFKLEDKPENIARHKCGYAQCPSCELYVDISQHRCFIQPPKRKRKQGGERNAKRQRVDEDSMVDSMADDENQEDGEKLPLHVFLDIEARQEQNDHVANLLVAETEESEIPVVFSGNDCIKQFLEWLEELAEEDERSVTVIAHNFQGYDGYFIVHEYYGSNQLIQQLRNGAKLLELKHDSIRFIDSLSFFAMPLSAFPKTFGLTELKKGYFPHLFNTLEHQDYVGPLPAKDYYMMESMTPKGKKEFEAWHKDQRDKEVVFDFAKELVEYCKSDVKLLKQGCLTFKELFE